MSLLSIIVAILVLLPGVFAWLNNSKKVENRLFLGLSLFLSLWVFFNTLVDMFDSTALLFTRLTFISITIGLVIFWDFTHNFPLKTKFIFPRILGYIIAFFLVFIALTDLFIPSVTFKDGVANVVTGPLYLLFVIYYVAFLTMAILRLVLNVRITKGIDRERTKMVLLAMLAMSIWTSLTNLFLPLLLGNNSLAPFGPFATLFFTVLIGYAMLRHRLFDIRAAIARAITYGATGFVLISLYLVILYLVTIILGEQALSENAERFVYIALALFSAIIFQPLRNKFDSMTSKIFFKGDYDVKTFLDEISGEISRTSDLNDLTKNSIDIIQSNLRSESVGLGVIEQSDQNNILVINTNNNRHTKNQFLDITDVFNGQIEKVLSQYQVDNARLRNKLVSQGIEVVVSLSTQDSQVAYIILGQKKNGEAYSQKDIEVLDIIADELAVAIQNSLRYEEISQFNLTLQEEIDQATKKLRRTNDKLKALDETKDEFISMASHQLRTPLTSVKGYVSMVLEGDAGPLNEQQEKLLTQAFISSQRMVYLIADLLNVSRLRTGKFVIERTSTSLPNVISGELDQLRETAKAKGLELNFIKPKDFPLVMLDETKTRQVIMNFIDNAMHYTPSGGKIKIELEASHGSIEFRVVDNGVGVPKDEQHHLFTKFYRANNARRMRPDGTGLGLFMAKKVIIAQGGAIIFKSSEGKGSAFGFTFPRSTLEAK